MKTLFPLAALGALALAAAPVQAQQPVLPKPGTGAPVKQAAQPAPARTVSVNGKQIPRTRIEAFVRQQTAQGQPDSPQLREAVTQQLINEELAVQEAEKRGLLKNAEVQSQLDVLRHQVAVQAFFRDHFRQHPVTESAMKAAYEQIKAQRSDREYKARHVLVEKEDDAKTIISQLRKGGNFAELARQSKDPSGEKGGDLGWQPAQTFVKPFADALVKLEKGKFTDQPVRSQFGWHVIQLDDVRTMPFPTFEQAKPQLESFVQRQEVQKVLANLRSKAKVE